MAEETVRIERTEHGIAHVILDKPEKGNAFDDTLITELTRAFNTLGEESGTRAVTLRSNGKHFSAGADMNWMRAAADQTKDQNFQDALRLAEMLAALDALPMPVIGRVQGAAMGGACGLMSCCDIVIAATSSFFALSEPRIGLIPAAISPYVLRAIGTRAARRYMLTGERIEANRAREIGLVHELVEDESLDTVVDEMIDGILRCSPQATRSAKSLVAAVAGQEIDNAIREETARRIADIRITPEAQEGLSAFLEKRRPSWVLSHG